MPQADYSELWEQWPLRKFKGAVRESKQGRKVRLAKAAEEKLQKMREAAEETQRNAKAIKESKEAAQKVKKVQKWEEKATAIREEAGKGQGFISKGWEGYKKAARTHPALTLMGTLGTASMLLPHMKEAIKGFLEQTGITHTREEALTDMIQRERSRLAYDQMLRRQEQEAEILRRQNAAMLMQRNPFLAMQLLAGRELPQGATVIGGQPRQDILERVAEQMSRGEFSGGESMNLGG